jgi:predicted sugar kinase
MLQMEFEPEDVTERVGDMLGMVTSRVKGDLERFKEFIESRQRETGAWRGEIEREPVEGEPGRVTS